jgi:hypothetical protein
MQGTSNASLLVVQPTSCRRTAHGRAVCFGALLRSKPCLDTTAQFSPLVMPILLFCNSRGVAQTNARRSPRSHPTSLCTPRLRKALLWTSFDLLAFRLCLPLTIMACAPLIMVGSKVNGAGYKLLCVAEDHAAAFYLSFVCVLALQKRVSSFSGHDVSLGHVFPACSPPSHGG